MMMNDGSKNGNGDKKSMPKTNGAQNIAIFCIMLGVIFLLVSIMAGVGLPGNPKETFEPNLVAGGLSGMFFIASFLFYMVS